MRNISRLVAVAAVVLACVSGAQAVDIETVTVGNPGNTGESSGECAGGHGPCCTDCGAVDYVYNIGKYEVTAGQYTEFLNAVAATDTYGLYNTSMANPSEGLFGCNIQRTGSSPNYSYSVGADWADRPVNHVSWGDAARFCNWLHNGQPTGAQDLTTTEDGSYYLNGATGTATLLVVREPDATWVVPSEDEWYKAAYHKNDGVTGNYWDYPTESDAAPTAEAPAGTDMTNGSANYSPDGYVIGAPYYRIEVGAYDAKPSDSPYGSFDQGGNVSEWNEAVFYGASRGLRGGSFYPYGYPLYAAFRGYYGGPPPFEGESFIGFRVALAQDCNGNGIPDECDISCGDTGGPCDVLGCGESDDTNNDGIPDECGACCGSFGAVGCLQLAQDLCSESGGVYLENGTVCHGSACPIPTVSEWGLVTMALLVLTAGTVVLARRRVVAHRAAA